MADRDPDSRKDSSGSAKAFAVAWTLPFALVVPMVIGGVAGFLLDRWLHTKPLFLLLLGFVGLGLGIREALKTASLLDKKNGG